VTSVSVVRTALAVLCLGVAACPRAFALDPSLDISQYAHTAWRIREGFPKGTVVSFAQTPDGYLWLGTEVGLVQFDGVRAVPWHPPAGTPLPNGRIYVLRAARDGTLWIGTSAGLASWDGTRLATYSRFRGVAIYGLVIDREGTLWVGAQAPTTGLLCRIRPDQTECFDDDGRFGAAVVGLYEGSDGALWVSAANGAWRWKPGPAVRYSVPDPMSLSSQNWAETAAGVVLNATSGAIWQLADGKVQPFPLLSSVAQRVQSRILFRDRDGALWVGTRDAGLLHVRNGRIDAFGASNGLSGDDVNTIFEDHEGNVWVATDSGLDRFRPLAATIYAKGQDLSGSVASLLSDRDQGIWFTTLSGWYQWRDGHIAAYRGRGLPDSTGGSLWQDRDGRVWVGLPSGVGYLDAGRFITVDGVPGGFIDAIVEDTMQNVWIAHRRLGLWRRSPGGALQQLRLPNARAGSGSESRVEGTAGPDPPWRLAADPMRGGVWIGFPSGGVSHLVDGQIRASYSNAEGLGTGHVNDIRVTADGTVWMATDSGVSRIHAGRVATLNSRNGLPCDGVDATLEDDAGSVWMYAPCGLTRIARSDVNAWSAAIDHGNATQPIQVTVLDSSDGVRSFSFPTSSWTPHAAKTRDGKLWFLTRDGVMTVDPHHLPRNDLPPPVHIEQVTADRKVYEPASGLRLPPLVRDLQIDYTALSLVAPEKNQFRVMLEGHDRDWQDVAARRQAFYNDLPPGGYHFKVAGSNNSGVWNEAGASLDFSIDPAYYQTNRFRAFSVLAVVALVWALYQLRVRQLAHEFDLRLEERINERTRIARELHDTLLQSFLGVRFRFQAARNLLDSRPAEAIHALDRALDQAGQAIKDGREAIQGLRASTLVQNELADAIAVLGTELAAQDPTATTPTLNIDIEGRARDLHPVVRDDLYRIAAEALRNAFGHAQARRIDVTIRYDVGVFRVLVKDDGIGIDPEQVEKHGEGHWGLSGMRERAELLGGTLRLMSKAGTGTQVELTVPGRHAYAATSNQQRFWRRRTPRSVA
jgi:signal transduction histidine kinase/ligand-binding sensor domain-containing protein